MSIIGAFHALAPKDIVQMTSFQKDCILSLLYHYLYYLEKSKIIPEVLRQKYPPNKSFFCEKMCFRSFFFLAQLVNLTA